MRRRHRSRHSHEDNSPPGTNYTSGHPSRDPTRNRAFPLPRGSTKEQQRSNEDTSTDNPSREHPIKKTDRQVRVGSQREGHPDPSSRCGGPRCERDMSVMMVMRGVGIVHVIAMRTTPLRVPNTLVCIPVRIPVRIPSEIEPFHFQEDLQRNNGGP